jgi:magnesium-transporting ATPase (P-type)
MTTIYKMNDQTYRIFVKGASEVIVEKCTWILIKDDYLEMTEAKRTEVKKNVIDRFANQALRTLAIAFKDV